MRKGYIIGGSFSQRQTLRSEGSTSSDQHGCHWEPSMVVGTLSSLPAPVVSLPAQPSGRHGRGCYKQASAIAWP